MAQCRIDFTLRPPGSATSWFQLTEGECDVVIADHHLFRAPDGRVAGYQVARFWEDLIQVLPAVRTAIPAPLGARAAHLERWLAWLERAWALDDVDDLLIAASAWWEHRRISSAHFVGAPTLYLWRVDDDLHVRWHAEPGWASPRGAAVIGYAAFAEEVQRFDHALMAAMRARTGTSARLRREQDDRESWLAHALAMPWTVQHTWDEVVAAVVALEARIGAVVPA